ncbi:MAG: lysophospholipid acyltransferase family protein [Blastocatellia bacterium]
MQTEAKANAAPVSQIGLLPKLRYYWTYVVAALCFVIMGIPVIPVAYVLRRFFGVPDFIYPFGKLGCRLYLRAAGARIHVSGFDHLDPHTPYVFLANHQSNLDPPLMFAYLRRNLGWIAKKELFRIPIMGQAFPLGNVIPIDRSNRQAAIESTRRGAAIVQRGRSVAAYPEGTRSADGVVKPFKKGVFFMATVSGVPIVPVVINDTRLVMRKGTNYCLPHDVFVELLPPISTQGYNEENLEALMEKVRAQFIAHVRTD